MTTVETTSARVLCAVAADGKWFAYGYAGGTEQDLLDAIYDMAAETEGELSFYYVNAELPIPTIAEVQGTVEKAGIVDVDTVIA